MQKFPISSQILFILLILSKEIPRFCQGFTKFGRAHLADGVKDESRLDGEETLWANETLLVQVPALKIGAVERN